MLTEKQKLTIDNLATLRNTGQRWQDELKHKLSKEAFMAHPHNFTWILSREIGANEKEIREYCHSKDYLRKGRVGWHKKKGTHNNSKLAGICTNIWIQPEGERYSKLSIEYIISDKPVLIHLLTANEILKKLKEIARKWEG